VIKAIIFDFDNTLINFMSIKKKAASAAAAKAMITAGLNRYRGVICQRQGGCLPENNGDDG